MCLEQSTLHSVYFHLPFAPIFWQCPLLSEGPESLLELYCSLGQSFSAVSQMSAEHNAGEILFTILLLHER